MLREAHDHEARDVWLEPAPAREPEAPASPAEERPPRFSSLLPGHVIAGRYEVLSVLGEGGMGVVYRCLDQGTGELAAIKRVLCTTSERAADYLTWFEKEARAIAALDHPHIVRARDFGQLADGSPFLAMDLAAGYSLHHLPYDNDDFPLVWQIVDQILSALAHAHARGIVHGDLKPGNVIVERIDGHPPHVQIFDFGLASLRGYVHEERLDGTRLPAYVPQVGAGTPGYMAPEQLDGELHHVCGATDLYCLGCIAYRLLARRPALAADSVKLVQGRAYSTPRKLEPVVRAPRGVVPFVMRLLARRPWERWEFAADCRRDWGLLRPTVAAGAWKYSQPESWEDASETPTRRTGRRGPCADLARARKFAPGLIGVRRSPLVGREAIREGLERVCNELASGSGEPQRLVLLTGELGVGKSRIAEWLCETMHERALMVPLRARYRCSAGAPDSLARAALEFYNLAKVDRRTLEYSLYERCKTDGRDERGRAWWRVAADWLRGSADNGQSRRPVIGHVLRRIAGERPLLIWLDDLQYAGADTFERLRELRSEPQLPVLVVATVRPDHSARRGLVAEWLRELRGSMPSDSFDVNPLSHETTVRLVKVCLAIDDAAAAEAARRSRGNPLFALQQVHAWASTGELVLAENVYRVPPDLLSLRAPTTAEIWDERLAALPEAYRRAAYTAAALGTELRVGALNAALTSLDLPPDALQQLEAADLIVPGAVDHYRWSHELLLEHLLVNLERHGYKHDFYAAAEAARSDHPS